MRRAERHRRRTWQLASASAGGAVIVVAVLLISGHRVDRVRPLDLGSDLMAIRAGLGDPPAEPVTIVPEYRDRFAVQRIPTTDDRVVFYLVGSRPIENTDEAEEPRPSAPRPSALEPES
jgi:hypothetical protein